MKTRGALLIFICTVILSIVLYPFLANAATTANIHIKPMSVNLGSVEVGGSASRTVTMKNTGKSDLVIESIVISGTDASEFSYSPMSGCPDSIPANGSCSVTVIFMPATPFGKKSAAISVSSNAPKPMMNVKLSGKAAPPKISASPMKMNFGSVNVGSTTTPKTATIKNTGISDLVISDINITGTNAQDFSQANNCSVVARGSSCSISVLFTPSSPASKESASLNVSSNDPKRPQLSVRLSGKGGGGTSGGTTHPGATDDNVMVVTVNGSLCSGSTSAFYPNKPCVSVTVCTPDTSNCQTIDDILLDTGSSGLRIFQQALDVSLIQEKAGAGSLAECIQYADGSSDWGPVQMASVILGNEPAVQVPIQVIDSTFGILPAGCANADQIPEDAGFHGILGVGLFAQDCGQDCSNIRDNGMYYVCDGSGCQGTAVPLSSQVQNPVAFLPQDNNGVIVEIPAVRLGGLPSVDGYLVLGIGTRANNVPSAVKTYTTDQYGEFTTVFKGITYRDSSFLDTGSNGLFFPSSGSLPNCYSQNSGWFCPLSTQSFSAVNQGSSGSPSGTVSFDIGNFDSLTSSPGNKVFAEIGGDEPLYFDWGLPFHFGRNIYVGLEGMSSSLGSGIYWAY